PFEVFGIEIDAEWRSERKWNRLQEALPDLKNKIVADIGSNNGYYLFRMAAHKPRLALGFEPHLHHHFTFKTLNSLAGQDNLKSEMIGVEQIGLFEGCFDVVFMMGILYHRRSPFDHLIALRDSLRTGGQLVLETLVIEGKAGEVLVPEGRYSKMGNVWFIPTVATLEAWLKKAGFKSPTLIDVSQTSTDEQRSTDWMTFHSLAEFLNSDDPSQTIEGYPAPRRATFIAEKP
ncbi:MAG: tRNA 5-methoxyuridine(34)/uridine 5-oxyacetic acid(34) synthase CmoB, partial [Gammaproteobacteria bacterium]|nr:tRNA 5-methoxyuridine(34)/uridine 5-oxyacetic acid(34) synthase CmoB [Gammaproteobacteria bacterium]